MQNNGYNIRIVCINAVDLLYKHTNYDKFITKIKT